VEVQKKQREREEEERKKKGKHKEKDKRKRGRSIEISLAFLTVDEIVEENERNSTVSQVSGFSTSNFFGLEVEEDRSGEGFRY